MNEFLNSQLVYNLRDVINKTDIFIKEPKEKEKFNLICAIMDRFDSSVEFLNQNQDFPKNDNAFINFLIYVSIIRDGINNVFKVLGLKIKSDNKIFEKYYKRDLPNINKEINDDKFRFTLCCFQFCSFSDIILSNSKIISEIISYFHFTYSISFLKGNVIENASLLLLYTSTPIESFSMPKIAKFVNK